MAAARKKAVQAAASRPSGDPKATTIAAPNPHQNHLLDALPASDCERLAPHVEHLEFKLGDVLYEPGAKMRYVYFPTTAIVSLLYVIKDGASAEIAIVGNEGILGISLFMGGETTPSRAVVQSAGYGYRMKAQVLKDEFGRFGPFMQLLLRYTQALITQMARCCRSCHPAGRRKVALSATPHIQKSRYPSPSAGAYPCKPDPGKLATEPISTPERASRSGIAGIWACIV